MGLQDVGVRLVAEGSAQFEATMNRANKSVANFGKDAGKSAKTFGTKWAALETKLASPQGMKMMIGTAGVAIGVLTTLGKTSKKLADDYMNYAFQVKDFGRIIGATPEEASKLIQVADDVRLSVGSMQTALRSAIIKGYTPNITGLGEMSDAYLAIQDPIARSRFLVETFGRSGLEMAKLMELGSVKIKEMGDSIEGTGRLMTQAGIDSATEYYKALDRLGESWEDLTLTIGRAATPVITKAANEMAGMAEAIPTLGQMIGVLDAAEKANVITVKDQLYYFGQYMQGLMTAPQIIALFEGRINTTTTSLRSVNAATSIAEYSLQMLGRSIALTGEEAWKSTDAYKSMIAGIQKAGEQKVQIGLEFTYPNIADKMQSLINSIKWEEVGGGALDKFMEGFAANVAPLSDADKKKVAEQVGAVGIALEIETGDLSKSEGIQQLRELADIDYTTAKTQIEAIMKLEPAEIGPYLENITNLAEPTEKAATNTEELEKKVKGLGMSITEHGGKVVTLSDNMLILEENARLAYAAVRDLSGAIKSIPAIPTIPGGGGGGGGGGRSGSSGSGGGSSNLLQAKGGPVAGRTVYIVGERGPELFIPDTSGYIVPNNKISFMAKGGKVTPEKAHMQALKKRWEAMHYNPNEEVSGEEGGGKERGDIERQASEAVSAIRAREDLAWGDLRLSVAEYNALVRSGASQATLAERKRMIDQQSREAQALTKLRTEAERQTTLLQDGTAEGIETSSIWMQSLIDKFRDFFTLLTSTEARQAMNTIDPLTAHSPAPLALGLEQISNEMRDLSVRNIPLFAGSISQLAGQNQGAGSWSNTYNINVPISATVGNNVDVKVLAYAVAKEIAANVRY